MKRRPEFDTVVGVVEHLKEERWEQFRNRHGDWGRDMVLYLARHHCGLTLKDLGKQAGLTNERSLAKAIHRFGLRLKEDAELGKRLALAQVQLSGCRDLTRMALTFLRLGQALLKPVENCWPLRKAAATKLTTIDGVTPSPETDSRLQITGRI
jgi:hypothetical protein